MLYMEYNAYGRETWTISEAMKKQLEAAEM